MGKQHVSFVVSVVREIFLTDMAKSLPSVRNQMPVQVASTAVLHSADHAREITI